MHALAFASADPQLVLDPIQVSPHCWFFQGQAGMATRANRGFMSNAGFVVTSDGVVVFDALGTPALGKAMLDAIHRVTSAPVRRIVVSHYHADHIYGLQSLASVGTEIWAQRNAGIYLHSGASIERLAQRRIELAPWIDEDTRIVAPDVWIDGDTDFRLGGVHFRLLYSGGAHSPEDLLMYVIDDRVLFAGDLVFAGRLPFVGSADSKAWLSAIDKMSGIQPPPVVVIPGHGAASRDPVRDFSVTRDYLLYLRESMGRAVHDLDPFEDAYAKTDWSRFKDLPAFAAANRANAYGTYLLLEQEALNDGVKARH